MVSSRNPERYPGKGIPFRERREWRECGKGKRRWIDGKGEKGVEKEKKWAERGGGEGKKGGE